LSQIHEKIISNNFYLLHQDYDEEDLLECKEILLESVILIMTANQQKGAGHGVNVIQPDITL
jgi:hypothetical protein